MVELDDQKLCWSLLLNVDVFATYLEGGFIFMSRFPFTSFRNIQIINVIWPINYVLNLVCLNHPFQKKHFY